MHVCGTWNENIDDGVSASVIRRTAVGSYAVPDGTRAIYLPAPSVETLGLDMLSASRTNFGPVLSLVANQDFIDTIHSY
jgi:hypothetical protein